MKWFVIVGFACIISSCGKGSGGDDPKPPENFRSQAWTFSSGNLVNAQYFSVKPNAAIRFRFSTAIDRTTVPGAFSLKEKAGATVGFTAGYENGDSTVVIQPASPLQYLSYYNIAFTPILKAKDGGSLLAGADISFMTQIDSSRKFPTITDDALLTLIQQQTFKYFWDFGHPVSGLARERNNGNNEVVTSGGSGFGIMSMIVAANRGFVTRTQALMRLQDMVGFLKNTAQRFHGAYPHWLNGTTGVVIPFSTKDNGADLVETSYLIQGLLCARQYFNGAAAAETALRADINSIVDGVEWSWFRQGSQNVLYWHWSPNYNFEMNLPIKGWNECLITYVLAASSTTFGIPASVYSGGWAGNGSNGFTNGTAYYGLTLPLGVSFGGPLFFEHYSFLGINPKSLSDVYANYETQTRNHTLINYNYCKENPNKFFGYSDSVWGLTASDIKGGYTASSPTNDAGYIAPTAALSSLPYTPAESMAAIRFFYYVLGNKIWKEYGFVDAFSLKEPWFAESFLAIDQGPIIVMIENHRTQLLWNLFTSCPEVKAGMSSLGFTAPYL